MGSQSALDNSCNLAITLKTATDGRTDGDTAQSAHPVTLATLAKAIPFSQIVFGTDFPFREGTEQVASLNSCGLSAEELRGIERENVLRLMPRLKI
jgi:6-methylsalicylate decarboxylase